MSSTKKELLIKLESISSLYKKVKAIKEKMNNFEPEDNYERTVNIPDFPGEYISDYDKKVCEILENDVEHTDDDAIEYMSSCYDKAYQPKKPDEPKVPKQPEKDTSRTDEYKKKLGCMPIVAGFIAVCSLISGGLFSGDTVTAVLNLVIIGICIIVTVVFFMKKKALEKEDAEATINAIKQYEQAKIELQEKHKKDMEAYQNDMNSYELQKSDFLKKYSSWRDIYIQSVKEEDKIEELLEKDRQAAVETINNEEFMPTLNELSELNDLVTEEYLPALDVIIDLLRSGRADDLKEAINLYEDIVYRERQLQLEREKEEQRRYEEELRRQEEERRHREDMAQREAAERRRRYDEQERLRVEDERRAREDKERAERERKAENAAKSEASRRCHWCKKYHSCSLRVKPPLNCAAFEPDITHHI